MPTCTIAQLAAEHGLQPTQVTRVLAGLGFKASGDHSPLPADVVRRAEDELHRLAERSAEACERDAAELQRELEAKARARSRPELGRTQARPQARSVPRAPAPAQSAPPAGGRGLGLPAVLEGIRSRQGIQAWTTPGGIPRRHSRVHGVGHRCLLLPPAGLGLGDPTKAGPPHLGLVLRDLTHEGQGLAFAASSVMRTAEGWTVKVYGQTLQGTLLCPAESPGTLVIQALQYADGLKRSYLRVYEADLVPLAGQSWEGFDPVALPSLAEPSPGHPSVGPGIVLLHP